jgi:hypothetical protein
MFQKANDVKSNLILNLLSWVDFLEPAYCVFENVRGFLSYNLRAVQLDEHRTAGGISMGGLKFLVHAMLAMKCVPFSPAATKHSLTALPQLPSPLLPAAGSALRHPTDARTILPPRSAARIPTPGGTTANTRLPADEPPRSPLPERRYRARCASPSLAPRRSVSCRLTTPSAICRALTGVCTLNVLVRLVEF